jgi:capsular polysaccharide biosynthesis protein
MQHDHRRLGGTVSDHLFEGEPGEAGAGFDRGGFVASAKRWWWLLVLAAVASGLMAYLVATRIPPTYTAETQFLVGPLSPTEEVLKAAQANTQTYAALAESDRVLEDALDGSGVVGLSPSTLRKDVSASGNQTTRILTISVTDENSEVATRLAEAIGDALTAFVGEVDSASAAGEAGGQGTGTSTTPTDTTGSTSTGPASTSPLPASHLEVTQPATATKTSGANTTLIVIGAAIGGLLVALFIAVVADSFTTSVRDEDDVVRLTGSSVLGSVDGWRGGREGLVVAAAPDSRASVAYRLLAMKIESMSGSARLRTLLVVTTESSDGGAELAANLAVVLASGEESVTLLDLGNRKEIQAVFHPNGARPNRPPLRRATLHRHEGIVLERFRVAGQSMTVAFPRSSLDSLDRDGAQSLLDSLLDDTEMVVINAPPVERSAATLALAGAADATVLVARARRTNRKKVGPAADSLRMVGANLIGTVLRDSRAV